jgi:hypothetical protein
MAQSRSSALESDAVDWPAQSEGGARDGQPAVARL